MAAPSGKQHSIFFLLKADSTLIGGATGVALSESNSMEGETTKDDDRWARNNYGLHGWEISYSAMRLESDGQVTGETGGGVKVELSDDGGSTFTELKGLTSASVSLSMDTADAHDNTSGGDEEFLPGTRSWTVDVEGNLLDPDSTDGAGYKILQDESDAKNKIELRLTFANGGSYEGTVLVESPEENFEDGTATFSCSFPGDGALSRTDGTRYTIGTADSTNDEFVISGTDATSDLSVGDTFRVEGSTSNDGIFTVASINFSTDTTIGTEESVSDNTGDGEIVAHYADEGLDALLEAFFASPPSSLSVLVERVDETGTAVTGAQKKSGTAWPTDITVDVPFDSDITVDGTLTGSGALTKTQQS